MCEQIVSGESALMRWLIKEFSPFVCASNKGLDETEPSLMAPKFRVLTRMRQCKILIAQCRYNYALTLCIVTPKYVRWQTVKIKRHSSGSTPFAKKKAIFRER